MRTAAAFLLCYAAGWLTRGAWTWATILEYRPKHRRPV